MHPLSVADRYHRDTKYSPTNIGNHPGLDWSRQPVPFKTFQSKRRVDLRPHLLLEQDEVSGFPLLTEHDVGPIDLARLSTLLLHTNGVTASASHGEETFYFRAAPSAGALYPTEVYVAAHGIEGLPDGIYNFQVREHALAPVCDGDFRRDLAALCFRHPEVERAACTLMFSAVFHRSSWRYQDRAYRRILLDTGHVVGNLVSFAPELGLHASPVGAFHDEGLNSLLLLDTQEEAMLAVVPLLDAADPGAAPAARPSPVAGPGSVDDAASLLLAMHHASDIASTEPPAAPAAGADLTDRWGTSEVKPLPRGELGWSGRRTSTILLRRSTREFTGAPITLEELGALLDDSYAPWRSEAALFDPSRLGTFVAVSRVTGLDAGIYFYDPAAHALHLRSRGDFSTRCGYICLGQDLGSAAAAVVFHCADLDDAIGAWGERGYRYLGLDAGHLGQRLNLAAIRSGLGVSGIGGYFDDQVNEMLGLSEGIACIYITCLGQPAAPLDDDETQS